jgi:hypothetical protein
MEYMCMVFFFATNGPMPIPWLTQGPMLCAEAHDIDVANNQPNTPYWHRSEVWSLAPFPGKAN